MMIKVHGDGLVLTPLSHFTESGLESIANKDLSVYTFKRLLIFCEYAGAA